MQEDRSRNKDKTQFLNPKNLKKNKKGETFKLRQTYSYYQVKSTILYTEVK